MSNPRSRRGKPRARNKDNVEAERVATLGEGANFSEKGTKKSWLAKRPVPHPDSKGKSLQKINSFLEILYIFDGNAHEDCTQIPKVNQRRRSIGFSRLCIFFMGTLMRILRLGFL